jgi:hypothetical protein
MNKSASRSNDQPNTGRRSFMWKAGAAVSAVLATAVPALSMPGFTRDKGLKSEVNRLNNKLGILEDENMIRRLHQAYETLLDKGSYENLVDLFIFDGEVIFNGGVFKGKDRGIQRLFCRLFSSGMTGKKIMPAPELELNNELQQSKIEISQDRGSAKARFPYSIQVGSPIISDSILVKMARLQGGGIMKWWEGGIYKASYVKDFKNGEWKIKSLEYQTISKADYKPGRLSVKPIDIPVFSKVYPKDQAGPDKLLKSADGSQKA